MKRDPLLHATQFIDVSCRWTVILPTPDRCDTKLSTLTLTVLPRLPLLRLSFAM
ncbi:hypothetical protein HGA64_05180 [Candidatus Falkowbacteria bacterium]|nr:hypothetical protein [Candidatus Falkowbacteria bacterium]